MPFPTVVRFVAFFATNLALLFSITPVVALTFASNMIAAPTLVATTRMTTARIGTVAALLHFGLVAATGTTITIIIVVAIVPVWTQVDARPPLLA